MVYARVDNNPFVRYATLSAVTTEVWMETTWVRGRFLVLADWGSRVRDGLYAMRCGGVEFLDGMGRGMGMGMQQHILIGS